MSTEIVTRPDLKTHEVRLKVKSPECEAPAAHLIKMIVDRKNRIEKTLIEVAKTFLVAAQETGRDLEELKKFYNSRLDFEEEVESCCGIKKASIYNLIDLHKNKALLGDGLAALRPDQHFTTLTGAMGFLRSLKKLPSVRDGQDPSDAEIQQAADRASSKVKQGTRSTHVLHDRVL